MWNTRPIIENINSQLLEISHRIVNILQTDFIFDLTGFEQNISWNNKNYTISTILSIQTPPTTTMIKKIR